MGRYLTDRIAVLAIVAKRANKLLIVRPDGIGDFVVWLDSARALREHFRDQKIVLIANQIFSDLAEKTGYFDEVIAVDPRAFEWNLAYRFKVVRQIRRLGAAIAIQPLFARLFWVGDAMIRASGAQERIGSVGDSNYMRLWQRCMARHWYTRQVPAMARPLSELKRNAEFLRGLGLEGSVTAIAKLGAVTELPPDLQIIGDYFIVFPGAGSTKRLWPSGSFAEVARSIAARTGWRLVVCGGPADGELARSVLEQAGLDGALSFAGKTSVSELVEIICGARLLVANETSSVHIAAAVGTPSVCVLGGGHFGRFVPYPDLGEGRAPVAVFNKMECFGCNWQCTLPHEAGQPTPCITAIPVAAVIAATDFVLSEQQRNVIKTH